jgi:replicative DNA helicase
MSITDDVRATEPRPNEGRGGEPRAGGDQFDRTPPQDVAAEQCALGGMLLSKDAIADVVEVLRSGDFYRPNHAVIFDAILDLYGRGEPADPITVAASLADSGDLARVGGAAYLHTLIASVPTAANAAYYAKIVSERAVLRRLIEAGTRIVQLGYGAVGGAGRDTDDLVDLAQQAVYDVTERRVSEDFAVLAEMLQPTLDEIEAVGAQGGVMTGVPTGFTDLDRLLNGLHPGQLIVVAGRPGLGKALALDTPLATPDGWTTMGEVRAGDQIFGADGRPTTVVHAFDVRHGRPCYEVEFSDGSVIVADGEHQWLTRTRRSRRGRQPPEVRTTGEIGRTVRTPAADRRPNHSIDNARPLALPDRDLPVPPYTMGVWLGSLQYGTDEPEIAMYVEADGDGSAARSTARVPAGYLRASEAQRRALLAGLLDTAGTVAAGGEVRYTSTRPELVEDVRELLVGLGYRCTTTNGYTLTFATVDDVFRLERKRLAHKERARSLRAGDTGHRYIVDVRRVPSVPVRCLQVACDDHLYLAGRSMVPTHNSTAAMDFSRAAAVKHNMPSAIFSLEMSKVEIVMRLLSAEARVPLHVLRSGQLSDDDWTKLARRMGEISEAPLFVDDTPNMNLMEIRAKARRLKQRHDLKLIVVDYLQLMTSPKRVESRQQEVADLSRGLKLLAKEVECPVVAVSQLNRGPEQRTDKRPQLSDLRESGSIEQDADVVILLHRDDYYDKESPRAGEADFIVAKHRNGPTDTVTVAAQLHLSRFVDMAI